MTNTPGEFGVSEADKKERGGDVSGGNNNYSSPAAVNSTSSATENSGQDSKGGFNASIPPPRTYLPPRQPGSFPPGNTNTANNRPGGPVNPQNQPSRNQEGMPARGNFNAVQNNVETRQSGGNNTPPNFQTKRDQPKQFGGGKGDDKNKGGGSGRSFAAWVVLALIVGGTLIWAKNRNGSKPVPSVKNEQVAEVLSAVPGDANKNSTTSTPTTIPPAVDNNTVVPKDSSKSQSPRIAAAAPSPTAYAPAPMGQGAQSADAGGGQKMAYRDPFAASIGIKLEDLKSQLVNLKADQESQLAVADKTNTVLENFKQQLLGLKDAGNAAGDLETQQANIAKLQESMASLHSAAEFVSLENARIVSLLSDMKTKLENLGSLVAAYNAGLTPNASI